MENHQIIEILPTRNYAEVARWLNTQPMPWKHRIALWALDMSATYAQPLSGLGATPRQGERAVRRNKGADPLYRARRVLVMGEDKLDQGATADPRASQRLNGFSTQDCEQHTRASEGADTHAHTEQSH